MTREQLQQIRAIVYDAYCEGDTEAEAMLVVIDAELAKPEPEPVAHYGIIDPDYARVFTMARCLAWQEGYALAMHGSFTRDLDLIAIPWTDSACDPDHLVRRIVQAADLEMHIGPSEKPHGRLAFTLMFKGFGDPRFIDLSVAQRQQTPVAPPSREWQGLSIDEMTHVTFETTNPQGSIGWIIDFGKAIEAALRAKNEEKNT